MVVSFTSRNKGAHTSDVVTQLDHVEAATTYGATVGPLDPGLQAIIMQYMSAREQLSDLAGILVAGRFSLDGNIVEMRSWHGLGGITGAFAKVS